MEDNQDDQERGGGKNIHIDPEAWLQSLLMLNTNPREKEKVVQRISTKVGITPEEVEKILQAALELMFKITRGN